MNESRPLSLAIIGGGPRCLYALESLSHVCKHASDFRAVSIVVFEPAAELGAGTIYAQDQPAYLRMNFPIGAIDAFGNRRAEATEQTVGPSLLQWLNESSGRSDVDAESVCSRAEVGRYLAAMFDRVVSDMPRHVTVEHRRAPVHRVVRSGERWELRCERDRAEFDRVLVVAGHEGFRSVNDGDNASRESENAGGSFGNPDRPIIDPIYPPAQRLSCDVVPPGSEIMFRGFGLTAIDAALACTEGRGGKFERSGLDRMRYLANGSEPAKMHLFSRSGRPMLAKPIPSLVRMDADNAVIDRVADSMGCFAKQLNDSEKTNALIDLVFDASDRLLMIRGEHRDCRSEFEGYLRREVDTRGAFESLQRSIETAVGLSKPGLLWALGEAWRRLYPTLVQVISHRRWTDRAWRDFHRFSIEMERLSFGPPVENAMRMVALWRDRRISVHSGPRDSSEPSRVETVADARIPSPHDWRSRGVIASLIRDGYAATDEICGAVTIDRCGRPLTSPQPNEGLHILGRCTEGCVLGNDTLGRTMHPHLDHWAKQLWTSANRLEPYAMA